MTVSDDDDELNMIVTAITDMEIIKTMIIIIFQFVKLSEKNQNETRDPTTKSFKFYFPAAAGVAMHVSSKPSLLAPDILVLDKFSDYTLFVILTKFQICRNCRTVEFQLLNLATD